ncbi:metallophosphoesterase family protein [Falsiroseomonas oryzae]|uniref:metallophosphoesterase family protein n=1 Tax=Falsiroseomonas oryzae TaxID=2766473 RepID=UPI0022EA58A8|nr:metallophosphoesterase family protein [Roseomonas sp. MO-31]
MRIAVITDIHGNLAALEAVLDDIALRGADSTLCLGDCASGLMWPRETTELLMDRGIPSVRGNHDRWLVDRAPDAMSRQDAVAFAETTADQRAWLGSLPERILPAPGVLACHGTPSSDTQNLLEEPRDGRLVPSSLETIRARLGEEGMAARVVLCGHSHQAGVVQVPAGPLVVNPGSLGLPGFRVTRPPHPHVAEARSPHARYAMLTLDEAGGDRVDLLAVPYDWEAAARRTEERGAPVWAKVIRTGFISFED